MGMFLELPRREREGREEQRSKTWRGREREGREDRVIKRQDRGRQKGWEEGEEARGWRKGGVVRRGDGRKEEEAGGKERG